MFENILDHEKEKEYLGSLINKKEFSHSYLFVGKSGIGKKKLAFEFVKNILGVENLATSADFKYVCRRPDKKDIVVEQVRKDIVDNVYLTPMGSDYKVYIIDDAQYLNKASQNTLLKTLEEPPKYVIIILISDTESNFLPTIISRVTKINFNKLSNISIKKYIDEHYKINVPETIIKFVDGSLGMLVNLIEQDYLKKLIEVEKLYNLILQKDVIKAFEFVENIDFNDNYNLNYLEYLFYVDGHYNAVDIVEKVKIKFKYNGNYDIVITNMILKIIKQWR